MEILDPVAEAARVSFGIPYLYPWQRLVIANILDAAAAEKETRAIATRSRESKDQGARATGENGDELHDEDGALRGNQIVLLPTGAGKSLCFQVPALLLDGPTLVVYPLLALMGDQARRIADTGLDAAVFRGSQSAEERAAQYRRLEGRDGREPAKLVIANPEVLAGEAVAARIAARGVAHLAIDEAHCVSEWGDTFRPAYLDLRRIIERLKPLAVTAFTATASPPVLARVADALFNGSAHLVRGEADRPNISYAVYRCRAKDAALIREVARRARPMVVFCATRGGTERAANLLRETLDDRDIRFYHAGLQKDEKIAVESWFHGHDRAILCCTCAWGMGVDKKDIRTVIHRDAPPTAEAYVQEAGRGGRDGERTEAVLLWGPDDRKRLERLPDRERQRAEVLIRFAEIARCRRETLLVALGDPRAVSSAPDGERIACAGCDVCDGSAVNVERDAELVVDYIRKNARGLSIDEAAERLYMAGNRVARRRTGYREWRRQDFPGIIDGLVKEGRLVVLGSWPWKGKLTVPRRARKR